MPQVPMEAPITATKTEIESQRIRIKEVGIKEIVEDTEREMDMNKEMAHPTHRMQQTNILARTRSSTIGE